MTARRVLTEGALLAIGQALSLLGSLIGLRFLTELMEPGEYGQLALCMTAATMANQVMLGPVANALVRYYPAARESAALPAFWLAGKRLIWICTAPMVALFVLVIAVAAGTGHPSPLVLGAATTVFATLSGYNAILTGLQNAAGNRVLVAMHLCLEGWSRFGLAAILAYLLWPTSTTAMSGFAVSAALVMLSLQYFLVRFRVVPAGNGAGNGAGNVAGDLASDWRARLWRFARPFTIWGAFTWLYHASDRWALALFASPEEVGRYAVLYQIGMYPVMVLITVAGQLVGPYLFNRAGDGTQVERVDSAARLSRAITGTILVLTVAGVSVASLWHAQIFSLLVASEYTRVSPLLPWLVLAAGLLAASQSIALELMARLKPEIMTTMKICTALIGVAINLAGAYFLGTTGVVIASVGFGFLSLGWMVLLARQARGRPCDASQPVA